MHDDDPYGDFGALQSWGPEDGSEAEDEAIARSRSRWVRWPAALMAVILLTAAVGAVFALFARRASRPDCSASAAAGVDLRGRRLNDAENLLQRGEYRCGESVVRLSVVSAVPCERDRPGTIVRQGRLGFDGAEQPVIRVEVCDASSTV